MKHAFVSTTLMMNCATLLMCVFHIVNVTMVTELRNGAAKANAERLTIYAELNG